MSAHTNKAWRNKRFSLALKLYNYVKVYIEQQHVNSFWRQVLSYLSDPSTDSGTKQCQTYSKNPVSLLFDNESYNIQSREANVLSVEHRLTCNICYRIFMSS